MILYIFNEWCIQKVSLWNRAMLKYCISDDMSLGILSRPWIFAHFQADVHNSSHHEEIRFTQFTYPFMPFFFRAYSFLGKCSWRYTSHLRTQSWSNLWWYHRRCGAIWIGARTYGCNAFRQSWSWSVLDVSSSIFLGVSRPGWELFSPESIMFVNGQVSWS